MIVLIDNILPVFDETTSKSSKKSFGRKLAQQLGSREGIRVGPWTGEGYPQGAAGTCLDDPQKKVGRRVSNPIRTLPKCLYALVVVCCSVLVVKVGVPWPFEIIFAD